MSDRSPPERLRKPNDNDTLWLLRKIWDRVNRRNKHYMLAIVGEEGSGKSHTAMKMAHMVDPTFTADRVIFDIAKLLRILKDGDHQPGQFYGLDEAGVQLGVRTWQDRGQILVNQCLQLIRNHNLGLIFTLPRLGELDSQAQGRLQAFIELTQMVDGEQVRGKYKWMDPDRTDQTGEIYKKFPRRTVGTNGVTRRIESIGFTPPPPKLVDPYEEAKAEFQNRFYERTLAELEDEQPDPEDERDPAWRTFDEIMSNGGPDQYLKVANNGREYYDADLIELDHGISARKAKQVKKLLAREHGGGEG